MAFLCPSRSVKSKEKKQKVPFLGRITGSASIDTLVRVGLEKQDGLKPDSKMVATQDFLPCADNELNLQKGQEVYMLYKENGWAYVITDKGKEGFVPNSFLISYNVYKRRSVLSSNSNDFTMWEIEEESELENSDHDEAPVKSDIDFSSSMSCEDFIKTEQEKCVVLYDFQIVNENDINVTRGEVVTLLNSDDNDWSWIVKANKQEGFIPTSFIYKLPQHLQSTDNVRSEPPPLPPRDYKPLNTTQSNNTCGIYQNNKLMTPGASRRLSPGKNNDQHVKIKEKQPTVAWDNSQKHVKNKESPKANCKYNENSHQIARNNDSKNTICQNNESSNEISRNKQSPKLISKNIEIQRSNNSPKADVTIKENPTPIVKYGGYASLKQKVNNMERQQPAFQRQSAQYKSIVKFNDSPKPSHVNHNEIRKSSVKFSLSSPTKVCPETMEGHKKRTSSESWTADIPSFDLNEEHQKTNVNTNLNGTVTNYNERRNFNVKTVSSPVLGNFNRKTVSNYDLGVRPPVSPKDTKARSPDYVKKMVLSDYITKTEPILSVTKGEIVFIDYNNQTNSTWLWVYSPAVNMYGSIPSSLLKDPYESGGQFSNIALV